MPTCRRPQVFAVALEHFREGGDDHLLGRGASRLFDMSTLRRPVVIQAARSPSGALAGVAATLSTQSRIASPSWVMIFADIAALSGGGRGRAPAIIDVPPLIATISASPFISSPVLGLGVPGLLPLRPNMVPAASISAPSPTISMTLSRMAASTVAISPAAGRKRVVPVTAGVKACRPDIGHGKRGSRATELRATNVKQAGAHGTPGTLPCA